MALQHHSPFFKRLCENIGRQNQAEIFCLGFQILLNTGRLCSYKMKHDVLYDEIHCYQSIGSVCDIKTFKLFSSRFGTERIDFLTVEQR